jgi:hypothetical protein
MPDTRPAATDARARPILHVSTSVLALLVVSLLLSSCYSLTTERLPGFDPRTVTNYAWIDPPKLEAAETTPEDQEALNTLRYALDRRLAAAGIPAVGLGEAVVLLRASLRAEPRTEGRDPYFASYSAERFEVGILEVELTDPGTGDLLWSGECSHRIRTVAWASGTSGRYVPTGERRNWQVEDMAREIVGALTER